MTWLQTHDGKKFDFITPDPAVICPRVLATVLSRICRFGGHCEPFYSVAQHSVHVSKLVGNNPAVELAALLHDAHEAYWGFSDVTSPAKRLDPGVQKFLTDYAYRIDRVVAARFGFDAVLFDHPRIATADLCALATEQRDLMAPPPAPWIEMPPPDVKQICPVESWEARRRFTERLEELWTKP